jgi:malate dehydrogenase
MERKDLLKDNAKIFKDQGSYLEQYAKKTVKVLVVGNPANTNALILIKNAPSINPVNFTALTRLDQNRLISQVSTRLNVESSIIKNVTIWGNHSSTQFPHVEHAFYKTIDKTVSVMEAINDIDYIEQELIKIVQTRGGEILKYRNLTSAASAAKAACDHMRDWTSGTDEGNWVSMAVYSNGEYNTSQDIVYSFPCYCKNGQWEIVKNLKLSDFAIKKLQITNKELLDEKMMALGT